MSESKPAEWALEKARQRHHKPHEDSWRGCILLRSCERCRSLARLLEEVAEAQHRADELVWLINGVNSALPVPESGPAEVALDQVLDHCMNADPPEPIFEESEGNPHDPACTAYGAWPGDGPCICGEDND